MSFRRAVAALVAAFACLAVLTPAPAHALPRTNPADRLLAVPVDELRYDNAKGCRKHMTKGALALATWLGRNTGGAYWGGMRCERLGAKSFSMHAEGRAVDWHLEAGNPAQRREADRLLALLFGPDKAGNPSALARRMGIIEAIWDCRYIGFWMDGGSKRYGACEGANGKLRKNVDPTTAHRNHIHFSLSWPGARLRTSYWRYAWLKQPLPDLSDPPFSGEAPSAETPSSPEPRAGRPRIAEPAPEPTEPAPAEETPWWADEPEGEAQETETTEYP